MSHLSVFDLFKIGIGPSSSHTVGPMRAACEFIAEIRNELSQVTTVNVDLYGSLSATGVGHGTDRAILLGLMGYSPETVAPDYLTSAFNAIKQNVQLVLDENNSNSKTIAFDYARHVHFHEHNLGYHPNGMTISAFNANGDLIHTNTYYSVGGGFIVNQSQVDNNELSVDAKIAPPYPFKTAAQLIALCTEHQLSVSQLMVQNELTWRSESEIKQGLQTIWNTMDDCIERGFKTKGILPGGLEVKRRAPEIHHSILSRKCDNLIASNMGAIDWVNLYAMAVNEENAAGGRIVTAPTNGAAGIVPAVLSYYMRFNHSASEDDAIDFLLAAAAIGILCKINASISGAEVGCQGEVGSACAMAAAGLAQVMNASVEQLENAAEIALEHNLGLTCDPIGGLVQIPCIERNAIASVKAINAVQIALHGDGKHHVSLDKVIITMRETGKDMMAKYKETSQGGLAVNYVEC